MNASNETVFPVPVGISKIPCPFSSNVYFSAYIYSNYSLYRNLYGKMTSMSSITNFIKDFKYIFFFT